MVFEIENTSAQEEILSVSKHEISLTIDTVSRGINAINSFINDFNEAHVGTPIQFNERYTRALFDDHLQDVAGVDFAEFIEKSPKFLQIQLNQLYKDFIAPIYDKSHSVYRAWGNAISRFYDLTSLSNLGGLVKITEDGKVFISEELEQKITDRFTVKSTDINPVLAQKVQQYIELENEIKEIVGKYNFKSVISTQCPIELNIEHHEFNIQKLTAYIKKHNIDTFTITKES